MGPQPGVTAAAGTWGALICCCRLHQCTCLEMKRFFQKLKRSIIFKEDLPPPYRENDLPPSYRDDELELSRHFGNLDLVANCRGPSTLESESEVEYAEIEEMGIRHSTPLSKRHKSKISLTWVLKENLENTKSPEKLHKELLKTSITDINRYQRQTKKVMENEKESRNRSIVYKDRSDRVVGRNEYYHSLKFKSACDLVIRDSCSDDYETAGEEWRRKHRHRHKRKKRPRISEKFGYDIRDLDSFLSQASIGRPGNIPVVVAYPSTLYQTHSSKQSELNLPLGTVVNAVFKNQHWLYAQTPHGQEGYVLYNACLPLGILPNRPSQQKKTPCWESSTDIYPRPCGNLTDTEKEQLRGRTKSESRYRPKSHDKRRTNVNSYAEEDFDSLYLKTKSVCSNIDSVYEDWEVKNKRKSVQSHSNTKRQMLLVVNSDFKGSAMNKTLTVRSGEVVVLAQERDVNSDWFYVKKRDGTQGFIPAVVAGNGYI